MRPRGPDAYQIFERAKRVLRTQSYPDPIVYRTTIRVCEGEKDEVEHFHGEAFSGGDIRVEGINDEERAAPHETSGLNFKLSLQIGWNTVGGGRTETDTRDAHRKEASPDFMGVPLISPSYSFGLASGRRRGPQNRLPSLRPDSLDRYRYGDCSRIKSLFARNGVVGRTVHISSTTSSRRAIPNASSVRELWVDAYTYQIVQLETQGNFTDASAIGGPLARGLSKRRQGASTSKARRPSSRSSCTTTEPSPRPDISFDEIRAADGSLPVLPTLDRGADINLRERSGP